MTTVWAPPQAHGETAPRAGLPDGDVRLGDGRLLRRRGPWPDARARACLRESAGRSSGWLYEGPKRLTVLASVDRTDRWGPLLHVSLSYPQHMPSWRDVRVVKEAFYGTARDAMMVLPRAQDYVNVHEFCLQMWECPEGWRMQ